MQTRNAIKKELVRHLIQKGKLDSFSGEFSVELVEDIHAKYQQSLKTTVACPSTEQGRRLNNFCIGSDPEFVFVNPGDNHKTQAAGFGMMPGLAVGCDQNQRLAELRGWPTRCIAEHVAGILASLRWMYRLHPETHGYYWRAGAHFDGDGLGGHVHFGRKRPNRDAEVLGLDGLAHLFKSARFFDNLGWDRRIQAVGDRLGQVYGAFGDIRPQLHGYEYRTLPSWLCTPRKAFVVLAASKLVVLDPEMTAPWRQRVFNTQMDGVNLLREFAGYYAGRDDDAWILKHLLMQQVFQDELPSWEVPARDFKRHWGFDLPTAPARYKTSNILPSVIRPDVSEIEEIQKHIVEGKPLTYREVEPTFKNTVPSGYRWLLSNGPISGLQYAGAGDLVHNVVESKSDPVHICFLDSPAISKDFWITFSPEEQRKVRQLFPGIRVTGDFARTIIFDRRGMGVKHLPDLRYFLFDMGLFPLWTVDRVRSESYLEFCKRRKAIQSSYVDRVKDL